MIEGALYNVLSTSSAITAIAATRIYPAVLPKNPTLPALTYRFIAGPVKPTMDTGGIQKSRVQIDCYAETFADAVNLRNAVVQTLHRYRDTNFQSLILDTGPDGFDHDLLQYVAIAEAYLWSPLGDATATSDSTPPVRSNGAPTGVLAAGTTQAMLSLNTNEAAIARYTTAPNVAYASMPNVFTSTGGTAHTTTVTGLQSGLTYSYYVRCQDTAGNVNTDDYVISFSVATAPSGVTVSSNFTGTESPLSESGMWGIAGSWVPLSKDNGAYSTSGTEGSRVATPSIGADQFAEITYDQDPGAAAWPGVMTRVQSASIGSCYLAIAYNGQVNLYRTVDTGSPTFTLLSSAAASVGTAPRRLRLESQGSTHRVFFNGSVLISYTDVTYAAGQPGIAASIFGGPTVKILTFLGGNL